MTTTVFVSLTHIECGECGVLFGMTPDFIEKRREDHRTWCCPNGHLRHYPGQSELEKTRDALAREKHCREQAQALADHHRAEAERIERRRVATVGVVTRMRRRVAHGVCPCCRRTFKQLAAHMRVKHPTFAGESHA